MLKIKFSENTLLHDYDVRISLLVPLLSSKLTSKVINVRILHAKQSFDSYFLHSCLKILQYIPIHENKSHKIDIYLF